MSFLSVFKRKKTYLIIGVVVLISYGVYRNYAARHKPPVYETVTVQQGTVEQTVEATGKLESIDTVSLRFEVPGLLAKVHVKEGDAITSGTILANLKLSELNASVAQAVANLNLRLAGATPEDRAYYESAVVSSKASLEQAKIDSVSQVTDAEAAVATAQNNLRVAVQGNQSEIITQAYENAVTKLLGVLPKLDDALTQADNILGIDNTTGNAAYIQYISSSDQSLLSSARQLYITAKNERILARTAISGLLTSSDQTMVDQGIIEAEKALGVVNNLLLQISVALSNSNPSGALTQTMLDSLKTSMQNTRSAIVAEISAITAVKQAIANAKNSVTTYQIAYEKAQRNLEQIRASTQSSIQIRQAAYDQAVASLAAKVNPPRAVDIATYRAAVAQAVAVRDKAYLRAPIDGVVTKIYKKVGELVSSADVAVNMLSPHYEIQVDIAEVDVPKLKIGNAVTVTLDAFGPDTTFTGQVATIDPASTLIQDVVYYKVRIRLDDTKALVKPGMTANVSVATARKENIMFIPARTIRTRDDGSRYVRVLVNGNEEERDVLVGLRGNEGKTEIIKGLQKDEEVIVSKKENGA